MAIYEGIDTNAALQQRILLDQVQGSGSKVHDKGLGFKVFAMMSQATSTLLLQHNEESARCFSAQQQRSERRGPSHLFTAPTPHPSMRLGRANLFFSGPGLWADGLTYRSSYALDFEGHKYSHHKWAARAMLVSR